MVSGLICYIIMEIRNLLMFYSFLLGSRNELQMEMVKQRLVHDFQLVPQSVLLESGYAEYRKDQPGTYTLSMGHSIQEVCHVNSRRAPDLNPLVCLLLVKVI